MSNRVRNLLAVLAALAAVFILWFGAHSARKVQLKSYPFAGRVVALHPGTNTVRVHNEEMPSFMEAMDMDYVVKDKSMRDQLKPGDVIHATLLSDHQGVWELQSVEITGSAVDPSAK
jgi:hypothetical protein